jgi:hypothetical protein
MQKPPAETQLLSLTLLKLDYSVNRNHCFFESAEAGGILHRKVQHGSPF